MLNFKLTANISNLRNTILKKAGIDVKRHRFIKPVRDEIYRYIADLIIDTAIGNVKNQTVGHTLKRSPLSRNERAWRKRKEKDSPYGGMSMLYKEGAFIDKKSYEYEIKSGQLVISLSKVKGALSRRSANEKYGFIKKIDRDYGKNYHKILPSQVDKFKEWIAQEIVKKYKDIVKIKFIN